MKKIYLIITCVLISGTFFTQIFSDNFDSYSVGQGLVSQNSTDWDTWTPSTPNEDVLISNANASSGSNSLYFSSNGGGPEDVILRYASVYNSGNFTLEMNVLVETGKGAYFNMQETWTVGAVWAIDCFMLDDGTLKLNNGANTALSTTYPTGTWFNLKIEIDLTANNWELLIDNVSQGSFSNTINSIGILDLYPTNPTAQGGNNISGFYIDDVSYDHTPAVLPAINGGITVVSQLNGIVGSMPNVNCSVRNLGLDTISSFDIEYSYNGGTAIQESIGPISLTSLSNYQHTFNSPVTLVSGNNSLTVTVSNVNGAGPDGNPSDDSKTITVSPKVSAPGKVVLGEEATGTWCGWCPRGAVFMDYMESTYGNAWAGVAVHNNDPMADSAYDTGLGFSSYPNALVDRGLEIDPQALEAEFLQRVQLAPTALITNGAFWNANTRQLDVSVTTIWQAAASGDWRLGVILTEDGLSGTTSDWGQSNSYSGGGSGVMGGYELLPSPVPASQMIYDHVARTIYPSFDGMNVFPSSISNGDTITECFSFSLPNNWDEDNIHIISFLRNPSTTIDNAGKETIISAITNGYKSCAVGINEVDILEKINFKLFPNPTNGTTYIDITNNDNKNISLTILDINGKIISTRDYHFNGTMKLPIFVNNLERGIYIVKLSIGESVQQQKLIVQ